MPATRRCRRPGARSSPHQHFRRGSGCPSSLAPRRRPLRLRVRAPLHRKSATARWASRSCSMQSRRQRHWPAPDSRPRRPANCRYSSGTLGRAVLEQPREFITASMGKHEKSCASGQQGQRLCRIEPAFARGPASCRQGAQIQRTKKQRLRRQDRSSNAPSGAQPSPALSSASSGIRWVARGIDSLHGRSAARGRRQRRREQRPRPRGGREATPASGRRRERARMCVGHALWRERRS